MAIQKKLLLLFLLSSFNLFGQSKQQFDQEAITNILYQHANDDIPGMAVGIVKDGEIIYEHYMGYSNLEHKIKIDKDTRFNIASNAKQFTALCILQLAEQGKLKLEDDFRMYLPSFYQNVEGSITISNLITHTSGIRDYCDLLALTEKTWWKQFIDNGDAIEILLGQKDLNFKPGTEYMYSNSNYILLTEIVKKVTGKSFSEFAKVMFEELGMSSTNFLTNYMAIIPNKARPYGNWNGWREEPAITEVHGDGALFTTLQDQLKWEQIIQLNEGKYFSKQFIEESQSPLASSIDNDYGYGLEFGRYAGLEYSFHNGSTSAYNATFLRFPTENVSIVVMTNNRNVPTNYLAQQLADYTMSLPEDSSPYPGMPDEIGSVVRTQDLLGVYQSDDGTIIKIVEKDGSLYRERHKRVPVKLIPEEGGLFAYETVKGMRMNFMNIGQAEQEFTCYHPGLKPKTYYKLYNLNSDLNTYDKSALNGNFYNDDTDTKISLQFLEDKTYSLTKNGRERKAELILEDQLRMNSYLIKVIRDKENNIIGLNLRFGRIKNVIFNRT